MLFIWLIVQGMFKSCFYKIDNLISTTYHINTGSQFQASSANTKIAEPQTKPSVQFSHVAEPQTEPTVQFGFGSVQTQVQDLTLASQSAQQHNWLYSEQGSLNSNYRLH